MQTNGTGCGVVFVTAPSRTEAEAIASALVAEKLAACVNLVEVHSVYVWKGEVNSEPEWQLIIKTNLARYSVLESRILELHPYEVPEIIALEIASGSPAYLDWIQANTSA